ncbi:MAG: alcohol dehydrogenase catalytic domain-containing protein [Actinomycetota bacterium]|nr:alcohol dehydrogenase catalytic domain-containing protein [Actinomycetota bacterium]
MPEIGPGEVLVRVHSVGLSRGLISVWLFTDMIKLLPATLGHEISGVVASVGPQVTNVTEGDRVHVYPPLGCGQESCDGCAQGDESRCPAFAMIGYAVFGTEGMPAYQRYHNGGMAEYVRVPAANLEILPAGLSFPAGCKLTTAAISVKALSAAREMVSGGTLLVTGATGANGSLAISCAPMFGFERVIAIAHHRPALDRLAKAFPHIHAVIATEELAAGWKKDGGLTEAIRKVTGGFDALLDFSPVEPFVIQQSLPALSRHGCAILMAGNPSLIQLNYLEIMTHSLRIWGSPHATRDDVRRAASLAGHGHLDIDPLVTHRFPLESAAEAMKAIMLRKDSPALVVLDVMEEQYAA